MGKISPSLRGAQFPVSFLKNSSSVQQAQSPKPHYFPKKTTQSKKPQKSNPSSNPSTNAPAIIFDSPRLSDAKSLFNSLVTTNQNIPSEARFYNSILESFSSVSTLNDSIALLNHMIKTHPPFSPDRSTYHLILMQACRAPDESLAGVHQALNLMSTNGFVPNKYTADVAVKALCSSEREEHAIELMKELCAKESPPDKYTYNFLVRHLVKNRSLSTVNGFINEMRDEFGIQPDLVTYTIMIDNVCNSKNLREATRLLGVLRDEGFKLDSYVYNTIMKGYCALSQGAEVLGVYNKMLEEGVKPDLVTYNTLVYGLSKSGRVKEAKKFLGVMTEMGHFPDAVTYTSLMNGMCREGDVLGAMLLLNEMEAKGCTPNSCTYNTLLHGLCKARLLDKGIELYSLMKESNMKLETGSYGTFLRALCRSGRVAEAYEVFDYAVESKSLTDAAAYSTLETTLKWLKKAREQGLVVSSE